MEYETLEMYSKQERSLSKYKFCGIKFAEEVRAEELRKYFVNAKIKS